MRSVADELRREARNEVAQLSPGERIELALRLGEDDLEAYRKRHRLDREEAIRQLQQQRQRGRRPSRCIQALLA